MSTRCWHQVTRTHFKRNTSGAILRSWIQIIKETYLLTHLCGSVRLFDLSVFQQPCTLPLELSTVWDFITYPHIAKYRFYFLNILDLINHSTINDFVTRFGEKFWTWIISFSKLQFSLLANTLICIVCVYFPISRYIINIKILLYLKLRLIIMISIDAVSLFRNTPIKIASLVISSKIIL